MLRLLVLKCWLQIQVILETLMFNFATDCTSTIEKAGLHNLEEFCLEWIEGCCWVFQTEGESFVVSPQCCSHETLVLCISEQLISRVSKVRTAQLSLNLNSPDNWKIGYYVWQNIKIYNKPALFTVPLQLLRFLAIAYLSYYVGKKI